MLSLHTNKFKDSTNLSQSCPLRVYADKYSVPDPEIVLKQSAIASEDKTKDTNSEIGLMAQLSGVNGQEQTESAAVEEASWSSAMKKIRRRTRRI